jgi:hypothetical protein
LALTVKNYYLCRFLRALDIGRAAGGENPFTASSSDDTAAKGEILLTAGSYAEPAAKAFITADYSARRGPIGHKPAVNVSPPVISKPLVKVLAVN